MPQVLGSSSVYRFGVFEFDPAALELRKRGMKIKLQGQPLEILAILLATPGEVVTREQLQGRLWPSDTFVDFEHSLNAAIKRLRDALDDSAVTPRYVETLARRGYRFIGSLEQNPKAATPVTAREPQAPAPRFSRFTLLIICTGALAILFAVMLILRFRRTPAPLDVKRITTTGNVQSVAISRDGRYLAYAAVDSEGKIALSLEQIETLATTQLLPPAALENMYPTFSPDGNLVYFTQFPETGAAGEVFAVPSLGGIPRKLFSGVRSAVGVAPDGQRLAFLRAKPGSENGEAKRGQLVTTTADGSGLRVISEGHWAFNAYFLGLRPDWSPDGSRIAVPTVDSSGVNRVGIFPADGQRPEQILQQPKWVFVNQVLWKPDGRDLLIYGSGDWDPSAHGLQLYELSYPEAHARRLTSGTDRYTDLSINGGNSIAAVRLERSSSIWVAPYGDPDHARLITPNQAFIASVVWSPDGQILYQNNLEQAFEVRSMLPDGSASRILPLKPMNAALYSACPNGTLLFCAIQEGHWRIWRTARDGSESKFITSGDGEGAPECTAGGKWVIYDSYNDRQAFKVPANGGQPVRIVSQAVDRPIPSPDGRWLAAVVFDSEHVYQGHSKLGIFELSSGILVRTLPRPPPFEGTVWHWTRDSKVLIYTSEQDRVPNLWLQSIAGGPPRQLTHFTSQGIQWFDLSPDGRQIAMNRMSNSSDAVQITNLP